MVPGHSLTVPVVTLSGDYDDGGGGDNGGDYVSEFFSPKLNNALLLLLHRSSAGVLETPNNSEKNKKVTKTLSAHSKS